MAAELVEGPIAESIPMVHIRTVNEDGILIAALARGQANALNSAMIKEFLGVVEAAVNDSNVRAMVVASDSEKFFSSGFDVAEVFAYDRADMIRFFGCFVDTYEGLRRFPKPTVAAVGGHAYAGGAILALACDFRVMAEGAYGFALNEVNLGIALPPGIIRLVESAVGAMNTRRLLLKGESISPERAFEIGLAEMVVDREALREKSLSEARSLADKAPGAYHSIKDSLRTAAETTRSTLDDELSAFIDQWFAEECMTRRKALARSMAGRRSNS